MTLVTHPRPAELAAAAAVAALVLAACGGGDDSPSGDSAAPSAGTGSDVGATAACDAEHTVEAGRAPQILTVDGLEREYVVHVPPAHDGTEAAPLILSLHGFGGDIAGQDASTGLPSAAGARGYIVVTPQGAPLDVPDDVPGAAEAAAFEGVTFWNFFGSDPGEVVVNGTAVPLGDIGADDVAFVDALLDRLLDEHCIDPDRVFATGMSNGAGMSTTLGCELGDRFAAIAPVAGVNLGGACPGDDPVSVLAIHGDADAVAGYEGNALMGFELGNPSVPDRMSAWAARDGCDAPPRTERSTRGLVVTRWSGCADGTEVELWTLAGGTHEWPRTEGPSNRAGIDATEVVLDFFDAQE
ncbi:MAG TPA: PHB depolymerase family esterase [Acidimicrobiales bacterium]|nr:PHB depolymerase family esterase [Acidimicrobiales bacterium]